MKISTIAISLTLTLSSLSSVASNLVFKPTNDKVETQACYLAATEGLSAAKAFVEKADLDFKTFKAMVSCNTLSLTSFAKKYEQKEPIETEFVPASIVTFVAENNRPESKVCLDSLVIGERKARIKHNIREDNIICNDRDIKAFVRTYKNQNVVVRNLAD